MSQISSWSSCNEATDHLGLRQKLGISLWVCTILGKKYLILVKEKQLVTGVWCFWITAFLFPLHVLNINRMAMSRCVFGYSSDSFHFLCKCGVFSHPLSPHHHSPPASNSRHWISGHKLLKIPEFEHWRSPQTISHSAKCFISFVRTSSLILSPTLTVLILKKERELAVKLETMRRCEYYKREL